MENGMCRYVFDKGEFGRAAITSRELKLPCVVGTGNATLIFRDNDLVEVDANKGIIRKLKEIKK